MLRRRDGSERRALFAFVPWCLGALVVVILPGGDGVTKNLQRCSGEVGTGTQVPAPAAAPEVLTAKRVPLDKQLFFLPDIVAWMNDESRRKLYLKSRRIGVTYASAYDRVSRRVRGLVRDCYYTGVSLDMAREFIDYCAFHLRRFRQVANIVEGENESTYVTADGKRRKLKINTFTIPFPSGCKTQAMPSRPAALRGRGGDLDVDELAHHEDQAGLYKAGASVIKWGGQLAAWSSPNGDGNDFWRFVGNCIAALRACRPDGADTAALYHQDVPLQELADAGRAVKRRPVFSFHRTTIVRAVDQGLVELLNRVSGANFTRASFLQECIDECLNEEHYKQEYLCEATSALLAALKYHIIEACQHEDVPTPFDGIEQLDLAVAQLRDVYTGGPLFIGADIGSTQDPTVLWVLEPVGDVLWTRLVYRLQNTSMVDQERAAEALFAVARRGRIAILKKGVGVGIFDHLVRRLGAARVVGIDESNPVKVALASGMVQTFEDRRIRVGLDGPIKEGLHAVREKRTPGGLISYDAPRDSAGHADEFWALAAALDGCALRERTGLTLDDLPVLAGISRAVRPAPASADPVTAYRQRRALRHGSAGRVGRGTW